MKSNKLPILLLSCLTIIGLFPSGVGRAEPLAYIGNHLDNTVSVIDVATDTVVDHFPSLPGGDLGPWGVAVRPGGREVYLSQPYFLPFAGGDQVAAIGASEDHSTQAVQVGRGALGIALDPSGRKVYQVNAEDGSITVIRTGNKATNTLDLGLSYPFGVAVGLVNGQVRLYVSENGGDRVAVVDPAQGVVMRRIGVGRSPTGLAVNPSGTRLYVANYRDHTVSVINTAANKVIRTAAVGYNPFGVAVNPSGTLVYVANQTKWTGGLATRGTVSVLDTKSSAETARVRVGRSPSGLAVTRDGAKVYVANTGSNSVSVIDARLTRPKVVKTVKVGAGPVAFGSFIKDQTLVEQYPTLAEHLQMDEDEFKTYLNHNLSGSLTPITIDSVKNMTIGAQVRSSESSFSVSPIFDIGLLDKASLLDKNLSSSTVAQTTIEMDSTKDATTYSKQQMLDFSVTGHYMGFKGSAAYHQTNQSQETESDGTINAKMTYVNSGAYIQIITDGFGDEPNFTPFLVGTKLDDATIKSYVDYTQSYVSGSSGDMYISSLKIKNNGKLYDSTNVYGNIQLLGAMEDLFSLLKDQYDTYTDTTIRTKLVTSMIKLKGSIGLAIKSFYTNYGDSMASKITAMNHAIGKGQLTFDTQTHNDQNTYSAALSVKYSCLGFGVSNSDSVTEARGRGWAKATSNMDVTAQSVPAGVIDTTAWAQSIATMMKNESAPISVPALPSLPTAAVATPPEPATAAKDPAQPPDSCFSSYKDWSDYRETLKPKPNQDMQQAQQNQQNIQVNGPVQALQNGQGGGGQVPGAQLYSSYRKELLHLKQNRVATAPVGTSNIMRIDNMFVSGFETVSYDQIIPQLRPNLDIPSQSSTLNGYPNISLLLLVVNQIGQAVTYIDFLSQYSTFTNVTPAVSQSFSSFYNDFAGRAFDEIITPALEQGVDISDALLASFGDAMFGHKNDTTSLGDSLLYSYIQDIDFCNYLTNWLLNPKYAYIWQNAPGGYIPFGFDANKNLSFYNLTGVTYLPTWASPASTVHTQLPYTNPTKNPLSFYDDGRATVKSPWFPIFLYNQNKAPILVFLQLAGPYPVIIGRESTILPAFVGQNYGAWTFSTLLTSSFYPTPSIPATDLANLFQDANSFIFDGIGHGARVNPLISGYSLYFPHSTPDPKRDLRLEALLINNYFTQMPNFPGWSFPIYGLGSIPTWQALQNDFVKYSYPGLGGLMAVKTETHQAVDLNGVVWGEYGAGLWCALLLPVNEQTCGADFSSAPSYSNPLGAAQIVQSGSFNPAYNISILD